MYSRLDKFLIPHFITTSKTDVFEETLLNAAGVQTHPTACRFDSRNDEILELKINGLTTEDATQFLNFIKSCGDENATLVLKDKTHIFTAQTKLVQDKLMDHFEKVFAALPVEVLAKYRKKSESESSVRIRIQHLLNANNFSDLTSELTKLLKKNYISEEKTGIFIKTLLHAAGIVTTPEACQMGPTNQNQLYFRVKGISQEDGEAFFRFIKDVTKDESASFSFVETNNILDINNDKKRLEAAFEFLVDKKLAYSILLPIFREQFLEMPKEKLMVYKKESLTDTTIKYKLEYDIRDQQDRLNKPLEEFLIPKLISPEHCPIFAETILRLAGVTQEPTSSEAAPIDKESMQFRFQGIDQEAAKKVLAYFSKISGEGGEVTVRLSNQDPQTYECIIAMDAVIGSLLPMFKEEFPNIPAEKLAVYEKQSEAHQYIGFIVFQKTLRSIIASAALLEANCPDAFAKGELHIVNMLLKSFERVTNEEIEDSLELLGGLSQAKFATNIYSNIFAESTVLQGMPEAQALNQNCERMQKSLDFLVEPMSRFGLFSGAPLKKSDEPAATAEHITSKRLV